MPTLTSNEVNEIVLQVMAAIARRRRKRIGKAVTMALAALSAGASIQTCFLSERVEEYADQRIQETTEPIQEATEELARRPYVAGLDTDFSQADRLIIVGTAFGAAAGSIELFYKKVPSGGEEPTGETRTPTLYLAGESIEQWADEEIIVRTTEQERQGMLDRVDEPDFADMIPYIRVVRADGTRSAVW